MQQANPRIVILGAGSIGCYLGGCLAAAGYPVTLIGRPRIQQEIATKGLSLSDWRGRQQQLSAQQIGFACDASPLAQAEVILVTVKGGDTLAAAQEIAASGNQQALVVSFQNGLRNGALLQQQLPAQQVLRGMVPFNVAHIGPGHFHCGSEGDLVVEQGDGREQPLLQAFAAAQLPVHCHRDMLQVQWGKLLMNLNNPINALSGVPLQQELQDAGYRQVLAASIDEGLQVLRAAGIKPARTGKVIPALLPKVLRLPTWLFRRLASAMLKIDPQARSSMAEDLDLRRHTEIDYLNGEIIHLGEQLQIATPVNRQIQAWVRAAESAAQGSPRLASAQMLKALAGNRP